MTSTNFMARLKMDDLEIDRRRAFFEITDEDLTLLGSLRPLAEQHSHAVVEGLYQLILAHPESRAHFADEHTVNHVKDMQRRYFLGLFSGVCDRRYVENRLRVGITHERVGVEPKLYIGAYGRYLRLLIDEFFSSLPPERARAASASVTKLIAFDMALAMDAYIMTNLDAVERHQAAIRELSTPVIRVHAGVLLLPLVGTVDTHRAQQVMETLLTRVVDEQARAVIIDIAGVSVVDTKVADSLLRTTEAVRLLGAATIVTGISAQIARTIVQLGVDISPMHTRARLAEGIELALALVGKVISVRAADGDRDLGDPA